MNTPYKSDVQRRLNSDLYIHLAPKVVSQTYEDKTKATLPKIREELDQRLKELPLLESERLKKKVKYGGVKSSKKKSQKSCDL